MTHTEPDCAQFRQRETCVSCGNSELDVVWSDSFANPPVMQNLERLFYSADLPALLGNQTFEMVRCRSCSMMFHAQILTAPWLLELYSHWIDDEQVKRFEASLGDNQLNAATAFEHGRQIFKHTVRLYQLLSKSFVTSSRFRALDFGCGEGKFIAALDMMGFAACGIDFSATRADQSARHGVSIYGTLDSLREAQSEPFHAVSLFQTLEHLDDPSGIMQEIDTLLVPGGILIIEVPDCSGIDGAPESFDAFHRVHPLEHINNFTPETLTAFFEARGFRKIARPPAHLTSRTSDLLRTELSRFLQSRSTNQYFRKQP